MYFSAMFNLPLATDWPTIVGAFLGALGGAAAGPLLTSRFTKRQRLGDLLHDATDRLETVGHTLKAVRGHAIMDGFGASDEGRKAIRLCQDAIVNAEKLRTRVMIAAGGESAVTKTLIATIDSAWDSWLKYNSVARLSPDHGYKIDGELPTKANNSVDAFDDAFKAFANAAHQRVK